MAIKYWMV